MSPSFLSQRVGRGASTTPLHQHPDGQQGLSPGGSVWIYRVAPSPVSPGGEEGISAWRPGMERGTPGTPPAPTSPLCGVPDGGESVHSAPRESLHLLWAQPLSKYQGMHLGVRKPVVSAHNGVCCGRRDTARAQRAETTSVQVEGNCPDLGWCVAQCPAVTQPHHYWETMGTGGHSFSPCGRERP